MITMGKKLTLYLNDEEVEKLTRLQHNLASSLGYEVGMTTLLRALVFSADYRSMEFRVWESIHSEGFPIYTKKKKRRV